MKKKFDEIEDYLDKKMLKISSKKDKKKKKTIYFNPNEAIIFSEIIHRPRCDDDYELQ